MNKIEDMKEFIKKYDETKDLLERIVIVDNCLFKNNSSNTRRVEIKGIGDSEYQFSSLVLVNEMPPEIHSKFIDLMNEWRTVVSEKLKKMENENE